MAQNPIVEGCFRTLHICGNQLRLVVCFFKRIVFFSICMFTPFFFYLHRHTVQICKDIFWLILLLFDLPLRRHDLLQKTTVVVYINQQLVMMSSSISRHNLSKKSMLIHTYRTVNAVNPAQRVRSSCKLGSLPQKKRCCRLPIIYEPIFPRFPKAQLKRWFFGAR